MEIDKEKKDMCSVSIIMPAFNEERYVKEALDSIFIGNSDFDDFEVLFVDDSSTDKTLEIVQKSYGAETRLHIMHGGGRGVSHARNIALECAKGKYIIFCDADDKIGRKSIKELVWRAEKTNADLVIGQMKIFHTYGYKITEVTEKLSKGNTIESNDPLLYRTMMITAKLYRKSMIDRHEIRFLPIAYAEDAAFYMECVFSSAKITGCKKKVAYEYRKRMFMEAPSVTQQMRMDLWEDFDYSNRYIEDLIRHHIPESDFESYREGFYIRVCENIVRAFWKNYWILTDEIRSRIGNVLKQYRQRMSAASYQKAILLGREDGYLGLLPHATMRPYKFICREEKREVRGNNCTYIQSDIEEIRQEDTIIHYAVMILIRNEVVGEALNWVLESIYRQDFPSFCVVLEKSNTDFPEKFRGMGNIYETEDGVSSDFVLTMRRPLGLFPSALSNLVRELLEKPAICATFANVRDMQGKKLSFRFRNKLRRFLPECIRSQKILPFFSDSHYQYSDSLWRREAYQIFLKNGKCTNEEMAQNRYAIFIEYE